MNIAVILLTQNRSDLTKQVIDRNFYNSGHDAHCYLIDNGSDEEQFTEILADADVNSVLDEIQAAYEEAQERKQRLQEANEGY